ncbi:MAG: hypothetical protein J2P17_33945, partial [Mycobacterium sp.]|nr:hypothetical protein [Mycobacterium sp.]
AVVFIPLAALLAVTMVAWPAARRRLGFLGPLVALVATVVTPLTTSAGEALVKTKKRLNPALTDHVHLGDQMLWWIAPLFVAITVFWGVTTFPGLRREGRLTLPARLFAGIAGIAAVCCAIGSVIWVYRIGDSGARSVWVY